MKKSAFKQVDVFTAEGFKGNPVAVVLNADGLDAEKMQAIANWTNLSETTFVLEPHDKAADYRVRIFTPLSELPFAGHPTIGTAFALVQAGKIKPHNGRLIQECAAGLISVDVQDTQKGALISFELPAQKFEPLEAEDVDRLEKLLGAEIDRLSTPVLVDVGARWIVCQLHSAASVLGVKPDFVEMAAIDQKYGATGTCVFGYYNNEDAFDIEVRSFAPSCGVMEDPVCGSGNGAVAAFTRSGGLKLQSPTSLRSSQGQMVGRSGEIALTIADDKILIGGYAVTCIDGEIVL